MNNKRRRLLAVITDEWQTAKEIAHKLNLTAQEVAVNCMILKIDGFIRSRPVKLKNRMILEYCKCCV